MADTTPTSNKKIIVTRTPALFRIAWAVVKRFFDPIVVNKIDGVLWRQLLSCPGKTRGFQRLASLHLSRYSSQSCWYTTKSKLYLAKIDLEVLKYTAPFKIDA